MLDFLMISTKSPKSGIIEIYPKFIIKKSSDLMIRGGDFYAIWIEEKGLWSTDEHDALQLIDNELKNYYEKNKDNFEAKVRVLYMWDASSGMIDAWHKYCQKQMRDNYIMLDETIIFSNHDTVKTDYASKKLTYPLEKGSIKAYDRLISVLFAPEERHKIEWAIGSIVTGDSKKIQKFVVFYGAAGTGKSTVLNIIQDLFDGYYSVFDARALGSSSNSFALEAFRSNPLVAIQHDGDLSRIEDNTRLNSLVSHEMMTVNEKFKSTYSNRFKAFLFMGTNKPVKITDGKSGLIRRLIDISPTGETVKISEYNRLMKRIKFELGAIAYHCKQVYLEDPGYYDNYIPVKMLGASNDFYNFVLDSFPIFNRDNGVTMKAAWEMYKLYCEEARVLYPHSQRIFKEELKNYFWEYYERKTLEDGTRVRSYYSGFRTDKFEELLIFSDNSDEDEEKLQLIKFTETKSVFDSLYFDAQAQYATEKETPYRKWENVDTTLKDLDTTKLHYVRPPDNHIVIDFDILDDKGDKSFTKNIEEASKWPKTYAELSKSGAGIHLHYIYDGDVEKLSRIYDENIEIKVFTGKSSLRRKLSKCNNEPIATINSGLPLKGKRNLIDFNVVQSERSLRSLIKRNLNKEIHASTKPSVDFIFKILEDAYASDLKYDVTDMRNAILAFAANSTNQAEYCIALVTKMKFSSEDNILSSKVDREDDAPIVFFDVEVFPNLFLVNWKYRGKKHKVVRMINPTSAEIEEILGYKLIGFNCRRYDNHILYGRLMGYTIEQIYELSQKIINGSKNAFFKEAYNLSYTDVYDFSSKKQSLKKFQIELGIYHKELGLPWDQPVPKDKWVEVAEYCDNDVFATEAVFEARQSDFTARKILAELAGMTVNDTTNTLTTKIIFGNDRAPQTQFNYRDMGHEPEEITDIRITPDWHFFDGFGDEYTKFDLSGKPIFPGYKFVAGVSTYRGETVGEGGYVYAEPGIYENVTVMDIASMHPSSIIAENLFGDVYTKRFKELVDLRVYIKHKDMKKAKQTFDGYFEKYLDSDEDLNVLSNALKIAINSVYGLTSASFDNAFRDIRNVDNIVAKRGALFMINLKNIVQSKGFTVAHIKTDSIKIPDATEEIIKFIIDYGKQYGYVFERDTVYKKFCLVNDAVFVAKDENDIWDAVGAQFQVPFVFKTLFSKEPIEFDDLCETKAVTTALYLDMNEDLPNVSVTEKELQNYLKKDKIDDQYVNTLKEKIKKGHNYIFIGKIGRFCPILEGHGGGILLRETKKKTGEIGYNSISGTKGFRWLEADMVSVLKKEESINLEYYHNFVNEAIATISKYGDYEWFVA